MAKKDAYLVLRDVTVPHVLHVGEEEGEKVYTTDRRAYGTGEYILANEMPPGVADATENAGFIEVAKVEEAVEARTPEVYSKYTPEHEAERTVLEEYGHDTVSEEDKLKAGSENAEWHAEVQAEQKKDGAADRPGLDPSNVADPTNHPLPEEAPASPQKRSRPGKK